MHAVVDAIRYHGEDKCFGKLFSWATIMIMELESDCGYDTCHTCPKYDPLLCAVEITNVLHTTPHRTIKELSLSPVNTNLLCKLELPQPYVKLMQLELANKKHGKVSKVRVNKNEN